VHILEVLKIEAKKKKKRLNQSSIMGSDRRTTLFVAGFSSRTRARDLAYEFERCVPYTMDAIYDHHAMVFYSKSRRVCCCCAEASFNDWGCNDARWASLEKTDGELH
jgi:hypothetical protein